MATTSPPVIVRYNSTVHQSTGHSPYELMSGRKPQLPIDALLGIAEESFGEGLVGDWVQNQQKFLQFAFARAEQQLKHSAAQRAQQQQAGQPQYSRWAPSSTGNDTLLVGTRSNTSGTVPGIWW